jgi:hypothetical protein
MTTKLEQKFSVLPASETAALSAVQSNGLPAPAAAAELTLPR